MKIGKLDTCSMYYATFLTKSVAGFQDFVTYTDGQSHLLSMRGLGYLTMELMQKYVKENIGIDDTTRWPVDSRAVDFLSSTTSAKSITDLCQVGPNSKCGSIH